MPALVADPVNFAFFQVAQGDGADGGLLAVQRVSSVFRPVVGSGNDNAVAEMRFAGSGEEAVDIFFLQGVISGVVFALDGVKFTVMCFCDQINTGIGLIDNAVLSAIFFDPIRIKQNFLIFFFSLIRLLV